MPLAPIQLARSRTASAPMAGTSLEPTTSRPPLVSVRAADSMGNASSEDGVPRLLLRDQAAGPETTDTHLHLPLVTAQPSPAIQGRSIGHHDRSPLAQQIDTAPSSLQPAFGVMSVAGETTPSLQQAPGQPSAAAGAGAADVDMEEVIEKAVQALMLKLEIERERRGFARWL